ncbi:hypothetical protein ACFL1T_04940, partial [Chlamydiota bacterium]
STTIISDSISEGNIPVLIVDYEYKSLEHFEQGTLGARGYQYIIDNIRVGATYVEEGKNGRVYRLGGIDVLMKFWENTQIGAEFAQSEHLPTGASFSTDGGLTFTDALFDREDRQQAIGLWGQTGLWNWGSLQVYYTKIEPGFVNMTLIDQEGSTKWGGVLSLMITEATTFYLKHDTQELSPEVGQITESIVGAKELSTTTAQLVHSLGRWTFLGEYQHKEIEEPIDGDDDEQADTVAMRVAYEVCKKFIPFIEQQLTIKGDDNNQTRVGAKFSLFDNTDILLRQTIGNRGNGTQLEIATWIDDKSQVYFTQNFERDKLDGKKWTSIQGIKSQVTERSSFYTEREYAGMERGTKEGTVVGYETKIARGLRGALGYERANVDYDDEETERDALSARISYSNQDFLRTASKVELRRDKASIEKRQWLTSNVAEIGIGKNIDLLGRANYSQTKNIDSDVIDAKFYELGVGIAFRPVSWDKLNFLAKYSYIYDLPLREESLDEPWILEKSHVYAFEGIYDINKYFQVVGKIALKNGEVTVDDMSSSDLETLLWINRLNFHVTKKWDIALEYRILEEKETDDKREGVLVEIDREIGKYLRLGVGYNFTDFTDDLRDADDDAQGFFVRMNGRF